MNEGRVLEDTSIFWRTLLCCWKTNTMIALFFFKNIFMAPQILIFCTHTHTQKNIVEYVLNIPIPVLVSRQLSNLLSLFCFLLILLFFGLKYSFKCSNVSSKFCNVLTKFFYKTGHLLNHWSQLKSYKRSIWNWINEQLVLFLGYLRNRKYLKTLLSQ